MGDGGGSVGGAGAANSHAAFCFRFVVFSGCFDLFYWWARCLWLVAGREIQILVERPASRCGAGSIAFRGGCVGDVCFCSGV